MKGRDFRSRQVTREAGSPQKRSTALAVVGEFARLPASLFCVCATHSADRSGSALEKEMMTMEGFLVAIVLLAILAAIATHEERKGTARAVSSRKGWLR